MPMAVQDKALGGRIRVSLDAGAEVITEPDDVVGREVCSHVCLGQR
jgi:hypothetical protein